MKQERTVFTPFRMALAAMLLSGPLALAAGALAPAFAAKTPADVSDLVDTLLDSVVSISITEKSKEEGDEGEPIADVPDGAPFEKEFQDFLDGKTSKGKTAGKVSSMGSGFVIDAKGYIVTNNHVIEGGETIEVNFTDGTKLKAKLVGTDPKTDLAVIKVEPKKPLKAVKLGDSRKMRIGDWVVVIGNPLGLGSSVSVGVISARNRNINAGPYDTFLQTDAAINRGNSGGPLFNLDGEVIGVNTAIISPTGGSIGLGFAIPTEIAANVVNQLKDFGEIRRGWLGVRIQPVTDDMAPALGLDRARGALISGLIDGGPDNGKSLKVGDVVISLDGEAINEMRDLPRIVAESPIGVPLKAEIIRGGTTSEVTVTLEQAADQARPVTAPESEDVTPTYPEVEPGDQAPADDPPLTPADTLGLTLKALDDATRKEFSISKDVEGVVITKVEDGSPAAQKGLKPGETVVEVAQSYVASPEDVADKITELKEADRRNAYLMIASPNGDLKLVAVPID